MKIYNEIVIDMNPESSSYGETLHEDSFEYNGEMMLMKGWQDPGWVMYDSEGNKYTAQIYIGDFNRTKNAIMYKNGAQVSATYGGLGERADAKAWFDSKSSGHGGIYADEATAAEMGQFTHKGSEFAPTFEEVKQYVGTEGGYGALEAGFGLEQGELGDFVGKPLEFIEEGFKLGTEGIGLEKEGIKLQEKTLTSRTGESLYDVREQGDIAEKKFGGVFSGQIEAQEKQQRKGVMTDYKVQQEELAVGREELALGHEQDVEAFWRQKYEELYEDVGIYEAEEAG